MPPCTLLPDGRRVQYYIAGYDDRWGKYSVTLNVGLRHRAVHCRGRSRFDFCRATRLTDSRATHSRANWQLQLAGPHLRGQLAWARRQIPVRAGADQTTPA